MAKKLGAAEPIEKTTRQLSVRSIESLEAELASLQEYIHLRKENTQN